MKTRLLLALILLVGLTACFGANSTPTPLPTLVLNAGTDSPEAALPTSGGIRAAGVVTAAEQVSLTFGAPGHLSVIHVAAGDTVQAGDLLTELENASLQAAYAQAESQLKAMTSPTALAAAELALANDQKALQTAQDKASGLNFARASVTRLENLQAEIDLANQALARAQEAYKNVARLPP